MPCIPCVPPPYHRPSLSSARLPPSPLQVGDKLKTREELRAEWEAFQQQQKKAELEASVNYRGVYQFKIDATGARRRPPGLIPRFGFLST